MRRAIVLLAAGGVAGCTAAPPAGPEPIARGGEKVASVPSAPAEVATGTFAPATPGCPPDMVLVEGRFCPAVDQRCDPHDAEYASNPEKRERCRKFLQPSRCVSDRRVLVRYCVDRYEWPNRKGEVPGVLVSFGDAARACDGAGKRLCDESEWLFACEGEDMLPYVTGYERDATACVIDRPYVPRPRKLERWDACMASPACRRDFEHVDQRQPSGAFERCASPFGVHDMNGNVNEWVSLPGEQYPHRSGLKGGWWGPVRDRCRPTVRFHDESDYGYEIGFRCCRDAAP